MPLLWGPEGHFDPGLPLQKTGGFKCLGIAKIRLSKLLLRSRGQSQAVLKQFRAVQERADAALLLALHCRAEIAAWL